MAEIQIDQEMLVAGIKGGHSDYEDRLIRSFLPGLKSMLIRLTHDSARAEDLAHETLLVTIQKLRKDGLENPNKLAAYIYTTARYQFLGWIRRRDNQMELCEGMDEFSSTQDSIEQSYIADESRHQVYQSISNLKVERDREILRRHYFQEQSKSEICDALLLNAHHYDKIISRARLRLKRVMTAQAA